MLATDTPAAKYQAIASLLPAVKHLSPEQRAVAVDALVQAAQVQPASLPRDLMMQSAEVRTLHSAGMQVGAHTVGHPILANLSDAEALHEIGASREILQALLGQPVSLFAYPNGRPRDDYTARDTGLAAKIGFDAAFSTAWGVAREGADRFQLPRFTPWDRSRMKFAMRLSLNLASRKAVDRV